MSPISRVLRLRLSPATWVTIADVFAVLTALALPWSTSLVAIFVLCWLGSAALMLDYGIYLQSLKRPICFLPFALVALALLGTLWSDAPWGARLYAVSPTIKLLVLPGLFYHFERSARGMWVLSAFLVSCVLLVVMSSVVAFDPAVSLKPVEEAARGIFVKNYIDQSQEFALCAVALAYPIIGLLRAKKIRLALLLGAIAVGFVVNMTFVTVSRTAMVTMPIMLAVFALLHLKWRTSLMIFGMVTLLSGLAWTTSPQLRLKTESFFTDYRLYKTGNVPTSIGIRLEFWRKSLRFFMEAPFIGHGTGSTRGLFEQAATGITYSATSQVIGNPHNQTLNVAVQWGTIGVVLLYAMWLVHLLLFRGEGLVAWIGLLVVVQNIFTSLFNSHLFDFHEGWMYVLGVGVAGGMTLAAKQRRASTEPFGP
ncbi:O-antigen ligase family protein [Bradyrhizobium sp. Ash2021]|nr:O-antigen ligase family protein [Bradyrhizobium sp. Ash2021]WMT79146.1 O-antigen ligase family protein [Bradyrhizobium sp. Ash2021]